MNRRYWIIPLVAVLVAACGEETPTQLDVEVKVDVGPKPPYFGKTQEFYENNEGPYDEMWAWCKQHPHSVLSDAVSKECGTVQHVQAMGGPLSRRPKLRTLSSKNAQLPSIPDARSKSSQ